MSRRGVMEGSSLLLIRGIVGLLVALVACPWPAVTIAVLVGIFALYAIVDGGMNLWLGMTRTLTRDRSWAHALQGAAGIATGLLTIAWPGVTALVIIWLIAVWAIVTGILEIAAA